MDNQHLSAPETAQINTAEPLYGAAALAVRDQLREPSDLDVAISVAQQLLDSDQVLSLREALRLLLRALDAEPETTTTTVTHANGLVFRVIPADSYDARIARDVRQLTMTDGTVWTVGTRGAGSTFAWRATASTPPEQHTPIGPGCGAPATARIEGYSPRGGVAHGSLDLAVYACAEHAAQARTDWLGGLRPDTMPLTTPAKCGQQFDYTTLGGAR